VKSVVLGEAGGIFAAGKTLLLRNPGVSANLTVLYFPAPKGSLKTLSEERALGPGEAPPPAWQPWGSFLHQSPQGTVDSV